MNKSIFPTTKGLFCALMLTVMGASLAVAQTITVPILSYRTGPFAATGIPLMNGQKDYFIMLNERDGGINGIRINYVECETGYNTQKGVECYERTKKDGILTQPWSTGITLQVIPKTNVDKVPVFSAAYGLSAGAIGDQFPWVFNPPVTYWDGASILLKHVADGDLSKLKGKKIALLHLDHPYGKEPIPYFEAMAEKNGFTFLTIPVGLKEMQNQASHWLQVRREKPDYVFMWGWGAMNAGALTEAVKTRFPMDKFLGIWWSGHDDDLALVGDKGKGYRSVSFNIPGNYPLINDIRKHVVDKGLSEVSGAERLQKTFYNRGVLLSVIIAEAIRTAQAKYGNIAIDSEQMRWGLENLDITEARLQELGMQGMANPLKLSCSDHNGHSGAWIIEWNGNKFERISDLIKPDTAVVRPMLEAAAAEYAKSNAPWPGRAGIACDS